MKSCPCRAFLLVMFLCSCLVSAARGEDYVWVEAESGTKKVQHSNPWYDPVDRETSLSGHDWWHSFDEPTMSSGYVEVPFTVQEGGKYRLWVRLDLSSTGYRVGLDGAKPEDLPVARWQKEDSDRRWDINHERRIFDRTYASHDGSNRHQLAWVKGPMLDLAAGRHSVRFEVKPGADNKGWAAVDCFVLAREGFDFFPRMFYKPGEKVVTAPEFDPQKAWPAWYEPDEFKESPIDLRRLNERVAGEHGFIRLSEDGEGFVRGDGKPIRFWSGSEYSWRIPFKDGNLRVSPTEREAVAHKARWLAEHGINMVRFHGHLPPVPPRGSKKGVTRDDINEVDLHGAWYMVAAFKKEGIYSTISPYWGVPRGQRAGVGSRLQRRQPERPGVLLQARPGYVQGLAQAPLRRGEPLHRHPAEGRSRPRHHPASERGLAAVLHREPDKRQAAPAAP